MIVEFIGCTGAGKSTLITPVLRQISAHTPATAAYALVAAPLGLQGIRHPSARNLIQEFVGLPFFLRAMPRYLPFVRFNLRIIARQLSPPAFALTHLRSLERKLAVYEMIRRWGQDQIVFVDEGTLLQAHHLFVFTERRLSAPELTRFARLLPAPDAVVYVRAPLPDLLQRSLRRPDPPRMLRGRPPEQRAVYLQRAVEVFDRLVQTEPLCGRVLVVDNPDAQRNDQAGVVSRIAEFIRGFDRIG